MAGKNLHKRISVDNSGFRYRFRYYPFQDVSHIYRYRGQLTIHDFALVMKSVTRSIDLKIDFHTGKSVRLYVDELTLLRGFKFDRSAELAFLEDFYTILANETFANRMRHYLNQIEDRGYFTIGKCRFYPNDRVITFDDRVFPVAKSAFRERYGEVTFQSRNSSMGEKLMQGLLIKGTPKFNVSTDSDVIFFLLDKLFGIRSFR